FAAEGPFVARDRGVRAADRVGVLDRLESAALFPGAGAPGGADRGAGASGVLRRASSGEPAGRGAPQRLAAVTTGAGVMVGRSPPSSACSHPARRWPHGAGSGTGASRADLGVRPTGATLDVMAMPRSGPGAGGRV